MLPNPRAYNETNGCWFHLRRQVFSEVGNKTLLTCHKTYIINIDLDPTKLKARQFSRGSGSVNSKTDNSLWTETPAERQQRLADEVSGKKRRVTDAPVDEDTTGANKRRKQDEERIKKGVDEYTVRLSSLSYHNRIFQPQHLAKT
jgi:hypothetical protein